jgi:hypothetical protein
LNKIKRFAGLEAGLVFFKRPETTVFVSGFFFPRSKFSVFKI